MARTLPVSTLIALKHWGDRYTAGPGGPPLEVRHAVCGEGHGPLMPSGAHTRPGPSARPLD